jgi:xanthine dehydrogenase accessory factor
MQSSQQHVIAQTHRWLEAGSPVWLSTILKTWGSSPRPVGAMMACTPEGDLAGSISGGCIEEDFLEQLRDGSLKARYDEEGGPFVVRYGITAEEAARLRLPCGGQLHVLLEWIAPDPETCEVFARLDEALADHRHVSRIVDRADGRISYRDGMDKSWCNTTDTGWCTA